MSFPSEIFGNYGDAANSHYQQHAIGERASNQPINATDWVALLDPTGQVQPLTNNPPSLDPVAPLPANTQISAITEQELSAYIIQEAQQWEANMASTPTPAVEQEPPPISLSPPSPPVQQPLPNPYQHTSQVPNTFGQPYNFPLGCSVARPAPVSTLDLNATHFLNGYRQALMTIQDSQVMGAPLPSFNPAYVPPPRASGQNQGVRQQPSPPFIQLPLTQSVSTPPTPFPHPTFLQPMPSMDHQVVPSLLSQSFSVKHERSEDLPLQWQPRPSQKSFTQGVNIAPIAGPSRRPATYRTISAPSSLFPQSTPSMNHQIVTFIPGAAPILQQNLNNVKYEQHDQIPLHWQPSSSTDSLPYGAAAPVAGPSRTPRSNRLDRMPFYKRAAHVTSRSGVDPTQPMSCKLHKVGGTPTEVCDEQFENGNDMMGHIGKRGPHGIHNDKQGKETFVCSWEGCQRGQQGLKASGGLLRHIREVHAGLPRNRKNKTVVDLEGTTI